MKISHILDDIIKNLTTEEILFFTVDRIKNDCIIRNILYNYNVDERSEDVIFHLLNYDQLPEDKREYIIKGCIKVYDDIFPSLCNRSMGIEEQVSFIKLSRVVDICTPLELKEYAFKVLEFALRYYREDVKILSASVRACMGYNDIDKLEIWERAIKVPTISAYAYNTMIKMGLSFDKLKSQLLFLCKKQIEDKEKWDINIPFLIRRTNRKFPNFIECIISELKEKNMLEYMREQFEDKEWSRKWLN